MPETYTKEQIEKAIETLKKCIEIEGRYETGPYRCRQPTLGGYVYVSKGVYTIPLTKERDVILSALSTAERERDTLLEMVDKSSGAIDVSRIWCDRFAQVSRAEKAESERDALKAQVAELEARLRGAAERGVDYVRYNLKEIWDNGTAKLRAAILGEKKE